MNSNTKAVRLFLWRLTAVHMITYFAMGLLFMYLFNYRNLFESGTLGLIMKPIDSPWVPLGLGLQLFRGLIFGIVLWPFKSVFLFKKNGWLKLWLLFIGLSILSTFGPAIGSIDGMIYTTIPVKQQLIFLPELVIQSFLLSFFTYYWYQKPKKIFNILSIILVVLIVLMSVAGFLAASNLIN
ncbi:MAG: hypothetical protein KAJ23_17550 [Maribacter sp.]|nr:hypothetical protein [Maribacter sp.]